MRRTIGFRAGGLSGGSGTQVTGVRRIYDQFLVNQVHTNTSAFSRLDAFHNQAGQVDNPPGRSCRPNSPQPPITSTLWFGSIETVPCFLIQPSTRSKIAGPSVPSLTEAQPATT